jgi:hypothetical protein
VSPGNDDAAIATGFTADVPMLRGCEADAHGVRAFLKHTVATEAATAGRVCAHESDSDPRGPQRGTRADDAVDDIAVTRVPPDAERHPWCRTQLGCAVAAESADALGSRRTATR